MKHTEIKNSLTDLKICCSFNSFIEREKIKTGLENDLVEMLWSYLEKNKKICQKCQ